MTTYGLHFILAVPARGGGHVTVTVTDVPEADTVKSFMSSTDSVYQIINDDGRVDIIDRRHVALLQITPEVQA